MKLVRFDGENTGLLVETTSGPAVLDVLASTDGLGGDDQARLRRLLGGTSWIALIEEWEDARGPLAALEEAATGGADGLTLRPLEDVTLSAPLPDPSPRVFAMGGNFMAHVDDTISGIEMDLPDSIKEAGKAGVPPWGFYVIPGTIVGPDAVITPPPHVTKLDYESEVAAVLTTAGDRSEPEVWGFTAWNDFSIRDEALGLMKIDHGPLTWALQKNFDTGNACGPCMVVDGGFGADAVQLSCRVNGEVRQETNTNQMTFSFADIAAHLGTYLTLHSGDMILGGSPGGTAMESGVDGPFLDDGDVTIVTVEGVGELVNEISMPSDQG